MIIELLPNFYKNQDNCIQFFNKHFYTMLNNLRTWSVIPHLVLSRIFQKLLSYFLAPVGHYF